MISDLGPFQWPILGNAVDLLRADPKFAYLAYDKLSKNYGNLMSLKIGVHDAGMPTPKHIF